MMEEEGEAPERVQRQSRNVSAGSEPAMDPAVQMELVYDKLCMLDYREKFIKPKAIKGFHKWYFAFPLTKTPSLQFNLFLDLCAWLMAEISGAYFLSLKKKN